MEEKRKCFSSFRFFCLWFATYMYWYMYRYLLTTGISEVKFASVVDISLWRELLQWQQRNPSWTLFVLVLFFLFFVGREEEVSSQLRNGTIFFSSGKYIFQDHLGMIVFEHMEQTILQLFSQWPGFLNGSEAGDDLVLIQTWIFLLCKSSLQWGLYQSKVTSSLACIQRQRELSTKL